MKLYSVTTHFEIEASSPAEAAGLVRDVIAERANAVAFTVTPQAPDGGYYRDHHVHVTVPGHTYH